MSRIKYLILLLAAGPLYAQGMLPSLAVPPSSSTVQGPLLIGQTVPATLKVVSSNGKLRPLVSYKAPLEVLVVGFFDDNCKENQNEWPAIRRFYEAYKDWHVAYLAIPADRSADPATLQRALEQQKIPIPTAQNPDGSPQALLKIRQIPEFIIFDESGVLRYRGPLRGIRQTASGGKPGAPYASKALETIIGHYESVPNPEPGEQVGCPIP